MKRYVKYHDIQMRPQFKDEQKKALSATYKDKRDLNYIPLLLFIDNHFNDIDILNEIILRDNQNDSINDKLKIQCENTANTIMRYNVC
jgi:hypothetical protein